jgi:D-threo-aldose 1-dehydrogenase
MDPLATRILGRTGVPLTQLGFGGAPIGELFTVISDNDAQATQDAAWEAGIRYYDTAPWYGRGLSEHRMGQALWRRPRDQYVISTKVGRVLRPAPDPATLDRSLWTGGLPFQHHFDYSYDGVMRSFEDSLQRLRLTRVDLLVIHDLDHQHHKTDRNVDAYMAQLYTGGWRALSELKAAGLIRGIGAGVNEMTVIPRYLDMIDLDFFIVALPYTLLDQDVLDEEFPRCVERGIGFVIGAVFSSGILATGPVPGAKYRYADPTPEVMERTRRIQAVCARHNVPLAAAAMQFPFGHPSVASVIPGAFKPAQVAQNVAAFRHSIPADLWAELKHEGLLRKDAPTP